MRSAFWGLLLLSSALAHEARPVLKAALTASRLESGGAHAPTLVAAISNDVLAKEEAATPDITEQAAIDFTYCLAAMDNCIENRYVLSLIYRRIGRGTVWERQKRKTFSLWVSFMLQFNEEVNIDIRQQCVVEGYRSWAMFQALNFDRPGCENLKEAILEVLGLGQFGEFTLSEKEKEEMECNPPHLLIVTF